MANELKLPSDLSLKIKALNTRLTAYVKEYGTDTSEYKQFVNRLEQLGIKTGLSASGYVKILPKTQQEWDILKLRNINRFIESGTLTKSKQEAQIKSMVESLGRKADFTYKKDGKTVTVKSDDLLKNKKLLLKMASDLHEFMTNLPDSVYRDDGLNERAHGGQFKSWGEAFKFVEDVEKYLEEQERALWT